MSKKIFIETLYKKRSTFADPDQAEMLANLLDTVSSDIYSESQRFIFELIQNADDAALSESNEIHFDFNSHSLIVSHKGKFFDEADINGITNAGKGTKSADATKTGYKGIGFKSVFGKSNRVTIQSDGYCFRFDRGYIKQSFDGIKMPWQIIPVWTECKDYNNGQHNVSTIIELDNAISLKSDLIELLSNGKILLFLRRITKISVANFGKSEFTIEKKLSDSRDGYTEVELLKNDTALSDWIVTTFDNIPIDEQTLIALKQDDKTPDKLKEAKFTEISFAAKIEKGKIKAIEGEESLIFTYLPTKVRDFKFPFLVNGSFLTNASREGIHEDRIWNQRLFQLIGEKIFDWLIILSKTKFKYQILNLLPNKFNSSYNWLKISFDKAFEVHGKTKYFIPNRASKLLRAQDILIDQTGLSELDFISLNSIIEFVNRISGKVFSNDSFVHNDLDLKHKINSLGAYIFDLKNLEDFFIDDIFKSNHLPSQNFALINYFHDKVNYSDNKVLNEKLKTIPFIYSSDNNLKSPKTLCFPSLTFTTEFGDEVSVIHEEIFSKIENNSKIKNWLEVIGVKEPSDLAYLENEIIGNIENCINENNYLRVTRYIFNQHKKNLLSEWHYYQLQDIKIYTISNEFIVAKECYLSDFFQPSLKLEKINEKGKYVSNLYVQPDDFISEWKTLFLKIGISESIQMNTIRWLEISEFEAHGVDEKYFVEGCNKAKAQPNYKKFPIENINHISVLTFFRFTKSFDFSKTYWVEVFNKYSPSDFSNTPTLDMGYWNGYCQIQNYSLWAFKNLEIFPTTLKTCLQAKDVFINNKEIKEIAGKYLPVFVCEVLPDEDWKNCIPFRQKIELEDYLQIIEAIALDTEKDEELKKSNKKRLGAVYNKLSEQISDLSEKKKNVISEWAKCNKLLSINENFENINDLKWIKIEGFTNTSEQLKLLFIPENCKSSEPDFEELMKLFGVQIIDCFIPDIKNKEPDASLKIQLQIILPYLSAILERKHYLNYSEEFKRLSDIIDTTDFYCASDIVLSFKNLDEIILGPSLDAYIDLDNKIYYKRKWASPLTLYSLIPELAKLLYLHGLNDELKLFLQIERSEIESWLLEQGYDFDKIKESPEYRITSEKISMNNAIASINDSEETFSTLETTRYKEIDKLLKDYNLTMEQLVSIINSYDADSNDFNPTFSSKNHLEQKAKEEENRVARELVYQRLTGEGFVFLQGIGKNSEVNGVIKNGIEYPLVVKSYRNSDYKFNIRPNEWIQLSKPNAMFWIHRGNGKLEVLHLNGLLRANSEFHVQFETSTFSFDGLVKFAEVFRFVRNVHFQLDAPNFSIAKTFEEYKFDHRENDSIAEGHDDTNLLE